MIKTLVGRLVLNDKWTSLGNYMIPKAKYTETIKDGFGGYCKYKPFSCEITIKDKYINDLGILRHEQAHARQYGRLFWLHSLLTMTSKTWRLISELEAYRSQVAVYGYTKESQYEWIVKAIHGKYNLRKSIEEIRELCDYVFSDLLESNNLVKV
jgi:hypothetical protein